MKFSNLCLITCITAASAFVPATSPGRLSFLTLDANKLVRKENSAVEITITAPSKATSAAFEKACQEVSKNVSIPGFRKGAKIPAKVLENAMAAKGGRTAIRAEAIRALVGELLEPALQDEGIQPIGQPNLVTSAEDLAESFVPGEEIDILVSCDVWPELSWKGEEPYKGLKASYKRKPFNQAKFDKALVDLQERYATNTKIEDDSVKLEMGNSCTVNMVGYMATAEGEKGEPLPNAASGDNVEVILGEGRYMAGLVEGLVGASVGETRTVTVSFPENLRDKTLAGKKAIFDVKVLEAATRTLPELNDDFAAKVRPDLTKESLEAELRKAIDEEDAKEYIGERNRSLGDALAEVVDVEVPDTIVTQQARDKYAHMMAEMRDGGTDDAEIKKLITPENFQKYKEIVAADIAKDFKISLASDAIAEAERLQTPPAEVDEQLGSLRKECESSNEPYDEAAFRPKVEQTLMRKTVFDFLAENADFDITYTDEGEPAFDAELMEKLADESVEREKQLVEDESGKDVDSNISVVAEETSEGSVVAEILEEPEVNDPEPEEVVEEVVETEVEKVKEEIIEEEVEEDDETRAARYASMSEADRNFAILVDLGMITIHQDPDGEGYDDSADDEFCPEYDL